MQYSNSLTVKFSLKQLRRGAALCCIEITASSDGVTYAATDTPGKIN